MKRLLTLMLGTFGLATAAPQAHASGEVTFGLGYRFLSIQTKQTQSFKFNSIAPSLQWFVGKHFGFGGYMSVYFPLSAAQDGERLSKLASVYPARVGSEILLGLTDRILLPTRHPMHLDITFGPHLDYLRMAGEDTVSFQHFAFGGAVALSYGLEVSPHVQFNTSIVAAYDGIDLLHGGNLVGASSVLVQLSIGPTNPSFLGVPLEQRRPQ